MKYFKLLTINVILSISCSNGTVWLRPQNDRGPAAAKSGTLCLTNIMLDYFYNPEITRAKNLVVMYSSNTTSPITEITLQIFEKINHLIAAGETDNIQLRVISDIKTLDKSAMYAEIRSDYNVLVIDDYEKLIYDMVHFISTSTSFNPSGKFIILYNNPNERLSSAMNGTIGDLGLLFSGSVFQMMYKRFNVVNVIICYATGTTTYDIYKSNAYRESDDCHTFKPILIDVCSNGQFNKPNETKMVLRINRISETLPFCSFKFCARVSEPFIDPGCNSGLEIEIIRIIKSVIKFNVNISCTQMARGEVDENGNWNHLLGMIRRDECDILVGGFFPDNEVHTDFGISSLYLQDAYRWYVPLARHKSHIESLIDIFQPNTWYIMVLLLILAASVWYILGKAIAEERPHRHFPLCALNTFAVFIGTSANNRPLSITLRIFFIFLALYGLTLTSLYTSKLITVFTNPSYEEQINSIHKVIKIGMPFGGLIEYHDWFDNDEDRLIYDKYNYSQQFEPTLVNLQRIRYRKQAMLLNRLYILSQPIKDNLFEIERNVFSNQLEMITERGFPALKKINRFINYMKDTGLTYKLLKDFVHNMTVLRNIKRTSEYNDEDDDSQTVLTLDHLQGAFVVLILGLLLSFLVFLLEILIGK